MSIEPQRVRDYMSQDVLTVSPDTEIMRAIHLLVEHDVSTLLHVSNQEVCAVHYKGIVQFPAAPGRIEVTVWFDVVNILEPFDFSVLYVDSCTFVDFHSLVE